MNLLEFYKNKLLTHFVYQKELQEANLNTVLNNQILEHEKKLKRMEKILNKIALINQNINLVNQYLVEATNNNIPQNPQGYSHAE
jgi:hypothetical protein